MALPLVQNILDDFPGWFSLDLLSNDQASTAGDNTTIVKSMADPVWTGHGASKWLTANELRYWRGRMAGLDNGRKMFLGYDSTACYPALYPKGSWPTGADFNGIAAVKAIGEDGVSVSLSGLPPGFEGSIGDMASAAYGADDPQALVLWRLVENFTADGIGETDLFEVRGAIPLDLAVGDVVALKRPSCHMILQPGSVKFPQEGRNGSFTFDAIQVPTP